MKTDSKTQHPLLTPREAARRLDVTTGTLQNWRSSGQGPAYVKLRSQVRYEIREVDFYARAKEDRTPLTLDQLSTWWGISIGAIYALRQEHNLTHTRNRRVTVYRGDAELFLRALSR